MKLTTLGSSSSGNGYVIEGKEDALIIEAGCPVINAKQALNYQVNKIRGVLISHEHL